MRTSTPFLVFLLACDQAAPDDPADPAECLEQAQAGEGTVTPLDAVEFRNAFDPSDPGVYDPDDGAALPGPVMVDTWGDRSSGAHGTLGVFPPGFVAPPHVHTGGYSGVVLRGELTNPFGTDLEPLLDGDSTNNHGTVVLGPGSYWHVPAGSQHSTTCRGPEVCWFYFYADEGFDFTPLIDETGQLAPGIQLEAPHADAVLTQSSELEYAGEDGSFVTFAGAAGDMTAGAHGTFGRFDAGAVSPLHVHSETYHGVVIEGSMSNPFNEAPNGEPLDLGGTWDVPADAVHVTACAEGTPCFFFFHAEGAFDFNVVCEQP